MNFLIADFLWVPVSNSKLYDPLPAMIVSPVKPHSHIHDFSHDYADLANRPSYTFRVHYYANLAFFLF